MSDMKNLAVTYFNTLLNDYPKATLELINLVRELYSKYLIEEDKLNQEDSEALVKALLNPSEPNKALLEAARRHKEIIVED